MIKYTGFLITGLFICFFAQAQQVKLSRGLKLSRSAKIAKANYRLDAITLEGVVLTVQGNDITIDFNNAELRGSNKLKNPDDFFGTGVLIRDSRNVTIKNLKVRGYKIGLLAVNVEKLVLENCDFSYNYRQHLNSTQQKEDIADWMSYHQNEKDEWKRYGAGIYLRGCDSLTVKNCRVTGGQNALMMTDCNDGLVYNNDFSFNSGIGIGMYRSSRNEILHNKINFNVRGYSHGVYSRGQDSAGILVYEQSSNNRFYKNSATHSGDGFFLWAGQTTMDTGKGGCNDNMIQDNDFSYAPTNGIEVTFSRNYISHNRIYECDHGIWGGYSYDSKISDNKFRNNRIAIAIEHGLHNRIDFNIFFNDKEAIKLWARKEQPADWGYARNRDTRSADYTIFRNSFNNNPVGLKASFTDSLRIDGNIYSNCDEPFQFDSTVTNIDSMPLELNIPEIEVPVLKDAIDPFKGGGLLAGRKNILVTEWGPYDFRSPIIWNTNPAEKGDTLEFDILGPAGKWKIKSIKGVKNLSAMAGIFPASIRALRIKGERTDIAIQLEYTGEAAITSPFGEKIRVGQPYRFSFRQFFQPINWSVRWYSLDTSKYNPIRGDGLFAPNVRMAPIKTEEANSLDYAWWGGLKAEETYKQFMTLAEGKANVPAGIYDLSVTWDDAVRVYVDNKLVLDEWQPSKYKFDESPNRKIRLKLGGNHQFRVEHLELGGFATLSLKLKPVN